MVPDRPSEHHWAVAVPSAPATELIVAAAFMEAILKTRCSPKSVVWFTDSMTTKGSHQHEARAMTNTYTNTQSGSTLENVTKRKITTNVDTGNVANDLVDVCAGKGSGDDTVRCWSCELPVVRMKPALNFERLIFWEDVLGWSASLHFARERTIRPETDPLFLLCHGLDRHHFCLSRSIVMSLLSVPLDTSKRRPSSHTTDLPARRVLYSSFRVPMTPVSSRCWMPCWHHCDLFPTSVHLTNLLDAVTRQFVTHPIALPISAPNVVTTRQLVLNAVFGTKLCPDFCYPSSCPGSNFCTNFCCSSLCPKFHDNPSSCSESNCCAKFCCSTFVAVRQQFLKPIFHFVTIRHVVRNPIFKFVTIRHLVPGPNFQICDHSSSRTGPDFGHLSQILIPSGC